MPITYRVGPGPARVRMTVRSDDAVRPIWTVTGAFRGHEWPDEYVMVGNHRDAWVYGGVDPSSGSAALVELARVLGVLAREGWRPKRSILFASWDAEEFAVTSSTEWGEQHEQWVRDRVVAYLNVDSAASGAQFAASAVPSLTRLLAEVAQDVRDPATRIPVAAVARERRGAERGVQLASSDDSFIEPRLGGGSDYTVFLNFIGVAVADLAFDGPPAVYHSTYDTHTWVSRFGDPGFRYHSTLVQLWGLAALRLAGADSLPLDPAASASRISGFIRELEHRATSMTTRPGAGGSVHFQDVRAACAELAKEATGFNERRTAALAAGDRATVERLNKTLLGFERSFHDSEGLPGRRWYRHLIHAPSFTYAPEVLPGMAGAVNANDGAQLAAQAARLASALRRAAARLREGG
jgi:N-acetylated-alpha-linked acidic dipeptidase